MCPLLFVIAMDYLTRLLKDAATKKDFQNHPGCKKEKVINLCFADDLLIFCKATTPAVQCVLEVFSEFSSISGLVSNKSKSSIYIGEVSDATKASLVAQTAFTRGYFPMYYLGVPLTSKKWSKTECLSLSLK